MKLQMLTVPLRSGGTTGGKSRRAFNSNGVSRARLSLRNAAGILLALILCSGTSSALTQDNPHGTLTLQCNACHTTAGWIPVEATPGFDHQTTSFPLIGRHLTTSCRACHTTLIFADAGAQCIDCHLDVHRGQFAQTSCEECHTPQTWNNEAEMLVRHQQTRFPLVGVHAALDCQQCHANGQFANVTTECQGCHLEHYLLTTTPAHAAAGFPTDCRLCHSMTIAKWASAQYNHATPSQIACYTCHATEYAQASNPNHAENQFSQTCTECHNTSAWRPATFDHNLSAFPLTGAHVNANCAECHVNGQYSGTSTSCWDCHQSEYNSADNPNHVENAFEHNCAQCHSTAAWAPAQFDHNLADFPLTGAHIGVNCASCHVSGQYAGTPSDCWSCHEQDYRDSDNPDHEAGLFSQACAECHTTAAWAPATFDHNQTDFPLHGAHVAATCQACHVDGQYANTPTACFACHQPDFDGAVDPNHVTGNFDHNCALCHTEEAWEPATFDHSGTDFPLTGAHITANCTQCHINGQFNNTPTDCWSCHEADYNGASEPNHASNQYPHACQDCHSTSAWEPSTFDHSNTAFPLTGAHLTASCLGCHVGGVFEGTPTDCWSCHQQDYEDVDDPNHVQNQFSHNCADCHTTTAWEPATFDHAGTDFPLTGAHIAVSCIACHIGGQYEGTPTDCWSCHQQDYEEVDDPNHVQGQFDHNCAVCHSTNAWTPATFDHDQTDFPLTGAHVSAGCTECHINGQYDGTPTQCFFCHEEDYNNADNPDHQGAGFPTTCQDCHTTFNWNSNFNHDPLFPIYSGRHQGEWNLCSDCHINPNDYGIFSCIDCHEHNQQDMDDEHDEVPGYVYESNACLACHPDGDGDDLHLPRPLVPNK